MKNNLEFLELLLEVTTTAKIDSPKYALSMKRIFLYEEITFKIPKMFVTMIEENYLLSKPIKMLCPDYNFVSG